MNPKNNKLTKTIVLDKDNLNKKVELPLSNPIYNKDNFRDFCDLEIDWNIKSIRKEDLPEELSDETCEFIDLFRRMTFDEKTEWEFYIDYENNEIIHCLHGEATSVKGKINSRLMKTKKIITIHNHPLGTYSAPSSTNFEILDHEFENFEIICSEDEYWILEAKGLFDIEFIEKLKINIENLFHKCDSGIYNNNDTNHEYGTHSPKYINNLKSNIKLIRKEYE